MDSSCKGWPSFIFRPVTLYTVTKRPILGPAAGVGSQKGGQPSGCHFPHLQSRKASLPRLPCSFCSMDAGALVMPYGGGQDLAGAGIPQGNFLKHVAASSTVFTQKSERASWEAHQSIDLSAPEHEKWLTSTI